MFLVQVLGGGGNPACEDFGGLEDKRGGREESYTRDTT